MAARRIINLWKSGTKKIRQLFSGKPKTQAAPPAGRESLLSSPHAGPAPAAVDKRRRRRRGKTHQSGGEPQTAPQTQQEQPWELAQFDVEPAEGRTRFHDLGLEDGIMRAIHVLGFSYCTPIQAEIMPHTLRGMDAFGKAQTGTGKSAAFLITILSRLLRDRDDRNRPPEAPRALVLAPTRELATQVQQDAEDLIRWCPLRSVAVFGGMDYEKQQRTISAAPVDILIATPGRLIDFARQRILRLDHVEILVIDEADRLLDMGFIPDVRRIIQQTPPREKRQTLLFSATLTPQIGTLAAQWTRDPVRIEIEPEQVASDSVEQLVYLAMVDEKFIVLYNLITQKKLERVIVFCNRRDTTHKVRDRLLRYGIDCAMLSGEVAQQQRMRTLERFKAGEIRVLVATDVAGRGLHIEGVSHVVNYNLPQDAEDYVHRIGRTGRAGATGTSVSFADERESFFLPDIETYMGRKLSCVYPEDELLAPLPPPTGPAPEESKWSPAPSRPGPRRPGGPGRPSSSGPRSPRRRPGR